MKQTLSTIRPRGVTGLLRTRLPVALQLRLAEQQGRLLWWSADTLVLLEAPGDDPLDEGSRWLRWLDRWWDLLLFVIPPALLLGGAAVIGRAAGGESWRLVAALICVVVAVAYVVGLMAAVVVRGFLTLYRLLILGRSREVTESGVGQVLASHWSIALCVLPETTADITVAAVLTAVQSRVSDLRLVSPDEEASQDDILCFTRGLTSRTSRRALLEDLRVHPFTEDPPILVLRADVTHQLVLPVAPPKVTGRLLLGIPWLVAGMGVVIAVSAQFVAEREQQRCAARFRGPGLTECADQPRTYGDALYWLLNRLFGGDPNGLGAETASARTLGLLVTLMGVVIVGGVITSLLQQAVERTRRFGQEVVDAYNESAPVIPSVGSTAALSEGPVTESAARTGRGLSCAALGGLVLGLALGTLLRARGGTRGASGESGPFDGPRPSVGARRGDLTERGVTCRAACLRYTG